MRKPKTHFGWGGRHDLLIPDYQIPEDHGKIANEVWKFYESGAECAQIHPINHTPQCVRGSWDDGIKTAGLKDKVKTAIRDFNVFLVRKDD